MPWTYSRREPVIMTMTKDHFGKMADNRYKCLGNRKKKRGRKAKRKDENDKTDDVKRMV